MRSPDYSGSEPLRDLHIEIQKNSVVTGIEQTTSGLLDQRRNRSDNHEYGTKPILISDFLNYAYNKAYPTNV